ncbi:glycosyltransferase [Geobacter sp.]|uniref:glycosyltransferase family 2 protein n=1 Tax=Geobacter sp. TaxID=46610 RepID=UPI0026232757|nr:glycosyltransferase [Geobacter sp.]
MNPLPKVSILIPTYGQQDFISSAVSSALAQSYPNLEVIVVDDASPDQTAEKVAAFRDHRLRYVRNAQNLGRVKNYRRALYELATGEWVVNLDGDDFYIDPDFISKAIELAYSEPGIVIVSARRNVVTATGTREPLLLDTTVLSGKEALLRYNDQRYHFSHLATLYHRPSALACDFYRMDVISSDWESLLRLALKGKVAYLGRVVGCWNLHGDNASLNNCWRDLVDNLKIWESIYQTASVMEVPRKTLGRARNATLLPITFRDLSLIFKGGAVLDAFRYLHYGFPILQTSVVLRILVHPYLWLKCGINIFRRIVR